jgi:hypothetical protein
MVKKKTKIYIPMIFHCQYKKKKKTRIRYLYKQIKTLTVVTLQTQSLLLFFISPNDDDTFKKINTSSRRIGRPEPFLPVQGRRRW